MGSFNQILQDGKPSITDTTWLITLRSSRLAHVTNIYGFLLISVNPMITKLNRVVNQHELTLQCRR